MYLCNLGWTWVAKTGLNSTVPFHMALVITYIWIGATVTTNLQSIFLQSMKYLKQTLYVLISIVYVTVTKYD